MTGISRKVISYGPPKEAALYFDEVLPFDMGVGLLATLPWLKSRFSEARINSIPVIDGVFDNNIVESLLGKHGSDIYRDHASIVFGCLMMNYLSVYDGKKEKEEPTHQLIDNFSELFDRAGISLKEVKSFVKNREDVTDFLNKRQDIIGDFLRRANYEGADSWYTDFKIEEMNLVSSPSKNVMIGACLRDLNLIDVDKVPWEAVIEFRKDTRSKSSLRDFRTFFLKNFSGMEKEEISDQLYSILHEYDVTRKAWGFETVKKSFAAAVSKQTIATSSVGALAAALLGAPTAALGVVGVAATLGGCALEFGQIAIDRWKSENIRPTRFLTDLREISRAN